MTVKLRARFSILGELYLAGRTAVKFAYLSAQVYQAAYAALFQSTRSEIDVEDMFA